MFSASCCLLRQMVGAEYEGSNSKSKPLTHYEVRNIMNYADVNIVRHSIEQSSISFYFFSQNRYS